MRLALIVSTLAAGGTERVVATLANAWAEKGLEISVLTLADEQPMPHYPLDDSVRLIFLGLSRSRFGVMAPWRLARRLWRLRRMVRWLNVDAVLAFGDKTNALAVFATRGLTVPVIVSERVDPKVQVETNGPVWSVLIKKAYRLADRVVLQTGGVSEWFRTRGIGHYSIIPNPVVAVPRTPRKRQGPGIQIVSMGRLVEQKGHDLLIEACSRLSPESDNWSLVIYGEGPLRDHLAGRAQHLGLADRVHFPGRADARLTVFEEADIFVLPSRYEGFPNALCEAMAAGLPVIAADCNFGPSEIVRDGVDGVLVPTGNPEELAKALQRLIGDPDERQRISQRAPGIVERFSLETVLGMWEALLRELADTRSA